MSSSVPCLRTISTMSRFWSFFAGWSRRRAEAGSSTISIALAPLYSFQGIGGCGPLASFHSQRRSHLDSPCIFSGDWRDYICNAAFRSSRFESMYDGRHASVCHGSNSHDSFPQSRCTGHWRRELRDLLSRSNWPKRAATASSSKRPRPPSTKSVESFSAPETLPLLRRAGIHPENLGAQTIHSLRIVAREMLAEITLPSKALSLTRRTLDEALLERAKQAGANILRGFTVERLLPPADEESRGLWRAKITNASHISMYISGSEAFLATGKHDLRGWQRQTNRSQNSLVALKMYFRLSPEQSAQLAGNVELIFYPGGYAGLQPVEGNAANLCALISREKLRSMGSRWDRLLEYMRLQSPHLERRLTGAESLLGRPLTLSSIPYGFSVESSFGTESPWRLGDQAAVIPSLCGDGMGSHCTLPGAPQSFTSGAKVLRYSTTRFAISSGGAFIFPLCSRAPSLPCRRSHT